MGVRLVWFGMWDRFPENGGACEKGIRTRLPGGRGRK